VTHYFFRSLYLNIPEHKQVNEKQSVGFFVVIPAQAGSKLFMAPLDSYLRGNDKQNVNLQCHGLQMGCHLDRRERSFDCVEGQDFSLRSK
jgi:hypothetical protein